MVLGIVCRWFESSFLSQTHDRSETAHGRWKIPRARAHAVGARFRGPVFPASVAVELPASEIVRVRDALAPLTNRLAGREAGCVNCAAILVQSGGDRGGGPA